MEVELKSSPVVKKTSFFVRGKRIGIRDFPNKNTIRWNPNRKQIVCEAVVQGFLTENQILSMYPNFSAKELSTMVKLYKIEGLTCLKKTRESKSNIPIFLDEPDLSKLEISGYTLSSNGTLAGPNDQEIRLTPLGTKVMQVLILNKGEVVSDRQMFGFIYGDKKMPEKKIFQVLVCRIRNAIKQTFGIDPIITHWGRGYSINM